MENTAVLVGEYVFDELVRRVVKTSRESSVASSISVAASTRDFSKLLVCSLHRETMDGSADVIFGPSGLNGSFCGFMSGFVASSYVKSIVRS